MNVKQADFPVRREGGRDDEQVASEDRSCKHVYELLQCLALRQRGRDGRSRLRDVVLFVGNRLGNDPAVVLVAPEDKICVVIKHVLRNVVVARVRNPVRKKAISSSADPHIEWTGARNHAPILMHQDHVEPVIALGRLEHSHSAMPQLVVEPRVADVADAIQGELRLALAKEDGRNVDAPAVRLGAIVVCAKIGLAKVVDETGYRKDVDGGEGAGLKRAKEECRYQIGPAYLV